MTQKKNQFLISLLKYAFGLGLGVLLLWLTLRSVDFSEIGDNFRKANYFWVLLALFVAILSHWFRALRWQMLLKAAGYESRAINLFASIMVGYLVNNAIPRGGEISRATLTSRTERLPMGVSFGTIVTDRIFDMLFLGMLVVGVLILESAQIMKIFDQASPGTPAQDEGLPWTWIALGGLALLGLLAFLFRRVIFSTSIGIRLEAFLREMWAAVKSVRKLRAPGLFILYSVGIWVCYILMTYLAFFSLEATKDMGFGFALVAFTMGGIGMVIPSPGGVGSYHYAVTMTFVVYHQYLGLTEAAAENIGASIAFIIHTSQFIMMVLVGFISYLFLVPRLQLAAEKDMQEEPRTEGGS